MAALVGLTFVATSSNASDLASDSSADAAYDGGSFANGSNGGTVFGAWTQTGSTNGSNGGYFSGSAAGNGDGDNDADGDINTGGDALAIYANGGQTVGATRTFTGGSLATGQTFQIAFDNGWIETGGTVGFILETSSGTDRFEFKFTGGDASYTIVDSSGNVNTGIGFTDEGLLLNVTLTGPDSYSAEVINLDGVGSTNVFNGTLANSGGVDQFNVYNSNAGGAVGGGQRDAYFNSFAVIPEPSTMALTSLGVLGLGMLRRRRMAK